MYAALLDACVLVPDALCDSLLRLAERGFFRPLWSDRILDETAWAIHEIHPEIPDERIRRRMNATFEDALVEGWEPVCAGLELADADDRHVLAAAIRGGAQTIVTFNVKDFPEELLEPSDVICTHPDDFLFDQLDLHPGRALRVLREQASDLRSPPCDLSDVLNHLERCGVPRFADQVRLLDTETPHHRSAAQAIF